MDYYEEKKKELTELLALVRKEKADLDYLASAKSHDVERAARQRQAELDKESREKHEELRKEREQLHRDKQVLSDLADEKCRGFPWLSKAYSDYFYLRDLQLADHLEAKSHPAVTAAQHMREIAAKRRASERAYRVLKYQLEYYENLFPWLVEFKGEDLDDLIRRVMERKEEGGKELQEPEDPARKWLTDAEYRTLPTAERNQRALDRYWRKKKSPWEIGRDYERYVGYCYESKGYAVYYQGIVEGFADLGRDLICAKADTAEVVQCKYWSKEKEIHEKHIFQLYGTVVAYRIDHPRKNVSACFATSTTLSERAKQFAKELSVKMLENYPLDRYPCVKCNVSRRDGTKIYHLPFDQQYDRTLVEPERNECYVAMVEEAEYLGFRRAFRWHGTAERNES